MDPLTGIQLVATAARFCELAFDVLTNLHRYFRNVRDAPTQTSDRGLNLLHGLLSAAQKLFERNPTFLELLFPVKCQACESY